MKVKVAESVVLTLTSCEFDGERHKQALQMVVSTAAQISELGYNCEVYVEDQLVDEKELMS